MSKIERDISHIEREVAEIGLNEEKAKMTKEWNEETKRLCREWWESPEGRAAIRSSMDNEN